jgi:hypothetical protein
MSVQGQKRQKVLSLPIAKSTIEDTGKIVPGATGIEDLGRM